MNSKEIEDLLKAARREMREGGLRKPYWRVFKSELPQCGAKTRKGEPCKARAAWDENRCAPQNGRCRLHGGFSTGPRTEEGRERSLQAGKLARERRWQKYREEKEKESKLPKQFPPKEEPTK